MIWRPLLAAYTPCSNDTLSLAPNERRSLEMLVEEFHWAHGVFYEYPGFENPGSISSLETITKIPFPNSCFMYVTRWGFLPDSRTLSFHFLLTCIGQRTTQVVPALQSLTAGSGGIS